MTTAASSPPSTDERAMPTTTDRVGRFVPLFPLISSAIVPLGYQPFIALGIKTTEEESIILCETQNEAGEFKDALQAHPLTGRCGFLDGLLKAVLGEVYDSGAAFFDWIMGAGSSVVEAGVWGKDDKPFAFYVGYPLLAVAEAGTVAVAQSPEQRAGQLVAMLEAFDATSGNEKLRWTINECLALALSKYFGSEGHYTTAKRFVGIGLSGSPYSIHLKAADYALTARLKGETVPPRLMKFIGPDNGALLGKICPEPFKRFDVGPSGEVLVCCGHWLPTNIGNIQSSSIDEVMNSETAMKIRKSMLDGSYKYCNHLECGAMIQGYLPDKDKTKDPILRKAIDEDEVRLEGVDNLMFAYDQSCNLSCPSCRVSRIVERPSESDHKAKTVEEKLVPLLKNLRVLNINPAGEFLFSKPSRRLLELLNRETCPNLKIDLISNGTLFDEREWNKFSNIHGMIRSIRISVDAASKETFETLRRLAVFEPFVENLTFLAGLRAKVAFPQLKFSFTYQLGNLREMKEFVTFAKSFNCDFVIFERLQNLGAFTDEEFRERAVHLSGHPLHAEFREIIGDPIFKDRSVWHDFEWDGASALTPLEAQLRLEELQMSA